MNKFHTDIRTGGWVERLPASWRPYIWLARLDRPAGIWLLLLPGWWAIMLAAGGAFALLPRDVWLLALFGAGAVIMRAAGCVINDLWDRDLDAQVARTRGRPLASGAISRRAAFIFLGGLLLAGAVILFQLPQAAIILGFLTLPLIVAYPLMKRVTWWPQLFLGLTFNFGALMGWAAVTGTLALPAFLLYAGGIFWTLGYDTIYAHQDREDDMRAGIKSTALRLGGDSKRWVAGFYAAGFALLLAAFIAAGAGILSCLVLLGAGAHLALQLRLWSPHLPVSSLTTFQSNRDFGMLVFLAAFIA